VIASSLFGWPEGQMLWVSLARPVPPSCRIFAINLAASWKIDGKTDVTTY
jgi:hypothetical protein